MSDNYQTTTLILAGGKGSRLNGVDKGLVTLAGKPLIDYSRDLAPKNSTVVASVNRNISAYRALAYNTLADQNDNYAGPMHAIWQAASQLTTEYLLVLPCDTPFLPQTIAELLLTPLQAGEMPASFASHNGRHLYCCMAATTSAIKQLSAPRSMRNLLEGINAQAVDCQAEKHAFLNINYSDDLAFAKQLTSNDYG